MLKQCDPQTLISMCTAAANTLMGMQSVDAVKCIIQLMDCSEVDVHSCSEHTKISVSLAADEESMSLVASTQLQMFPALFDKMFMTPHDPKSLYDILCAIDESLPTAGALNTYLPIEPGYVIEGFDSQVWVDLCCVLLCKHAVAQLNERSSRLPRDTRLLLADVYQLQSKLSPRLKSHFKAANEKDKMARNIWSVSKQSHDDFNKASSVATDLQMFWG